MSNLVNHAERELKLDGWYQYNDEWAGMIKDAVLELIKTFASQGHSGISADITSELFHKLSRFRTLSENDHSDYTDRTEISFSEAQIAAGMTLLQCNRDSRFFSNDNGATWYNIDDD
jgi:hypothetical protein